MLGCVEHEKCFITLGLGTMLCDFFPCIVLACNSVCCSSNVTYQVPNEQNPTSETDDKFSERCLSASKCHYENMPMQYTENILVVKNKIFTGKILIFFFIFAQNIDCGYTLEPPRQGNSNKYPQSMF